MSTPENFVPFMAHGEATLDTAAQAIQGALDLLGPDGENWIQGALVEGSSYCVVGALERGAANYESYDLARRAISETVGGSVDRFNNRATWGEVREALKATQARLEVQSYLSSRPEFT